MKYLFWGFLGIVAIVGIWGFLGLVAIVDIMTSENTPDADGKI
jgi:hypothetical protein